MQPMLDPKRDLAGATPETLARALFRPLRRRPPDGVRKDERDPGVAGTQPAAVRDQCGQQAEDGV